MQRSNEESGKVLFDYLRDILYAPQATAPNLEELAEPFQNLGAGMKILQKYIEEMRIYSSNLSKGDLNSFQPARDNFLCANLKNLQANLNHLTWQAKQVAAGDYNQRVSYLGDFSTAFNTMIDQLKEREALLEDKYQEANERVRVMGEHAYMDPLTGINNRLYFEEQIKDEIRNKRNMVMCYLDLDGLKYVNDNFGHKEGDKYLRKFTATIKFSFRLIDSFARIGGDEFCLLLKGMSKWDAIARLERIREKFIAENKEAYPVSFSYGVVDLDDYAIGFNVSDVLENADKVMYEYKKLHKKSRDNQPEPAQHEHCAIDDVACNALADAKAAKGAFQQAATAADKAAENAVKANGEPNPHEESETVD